MRHFCIGVAAGVVAALAPWGPCLGQAAGEAGERGGEAAGQAPAPPASGTRALRAGDPVPRVSRLEWIEGEAVDLNDGKNVYLVEFWATWCVPCIQQMPRLRELQARFKDRGLVVVGMNSGDTDIRLVREFLGKRRAPGYRVAFDADKSLWRKIAAAGGFEAIPLALVIDRSGKIAYLDHPEPGLEAVVERVINGTWDPVRDSLPVPRKAALAREVRELVKRGDFEGASEALDKAVFSDPVLAGLAGKLRFKIAYFDQADCRKAYAIAERELAGAAGQDAEALADIAEWMINEGQPEFRDNPLAAKLAARAVELTHWKDGSIIDILARCHIHLGNLERAVELQSRAVEVTPEGQARANLAETLRLMRAKLERSKGK